MNNTLPRFPYINKVQDDAVTRENIRQQEVLASHRFGGDRDLHRSKTEQVATAMKEVSATDQETAANAAVGAYREAKAGKEVVEATIRAIGSLAGDVEQAARAGEALASITTAVERINEMNTQIATAAEEQTAVAEEINRNVVSISQVANQTAAGTEEITAVSDETLRLAQNVQSLANGLSAASR